MGLDVYAGTLTRYYARRWETSTQRFARENGIAFQRFTPQGVADTSPEPDVEAVHEGIVGWQSFILSSLPHEEDKPFNPWPEDCERPYYTDKPAWDAMGALILASACAAYDEPLPEKVEKGWEYFKHPLISRLAEDREHISSLSRDTVFWLPIEGRLLFSGPCPNGNGSRFADVTVLEEELNSINRALWQANEDTILSWTQNEGYPTEAELVKKPKGKGIKLLYKEETVQVYDTESLAKFAFSIFYRAVRFSRENEVPIVLDF